MTPSMSRPVTEASTGTAEPSARTSSSSAWRVVPGAVVASRDESVSAADASTSSVTSRPSSAARSAPISSASRRLA